MVAVVLVLVAAGLALVGGPADAAMDHEIVVVVAPAAPALRFGSGEDGPTTGVPSLDRVIRAVGVDRAEPFYPGVLRRTELRRALARMLRLTLAPGRDRDAALRALRADPHVVSAEPRAPFVLHYTPDDPRFSEQWFLTHVRADSAWAAVGAPETRAALVGIVDSGVFWEHPDLAANIWVNDPEDLDGDGKLSPADINGVDDDGNGFVDDVVGWDFGENDNDPREDDLEHGTSIAGATAEATDNDLLGAGIGFAARLLPVKIFTAGGGLTDPYVGMVYACENGADVVNCSWGTGVFVAAEQTIVSALRAAGCLVVASAGGGGGTVPTYPAAYEHVVAVSATDQLDHKASFAGYGEWVDVCAPGVDIRTIQGEDGFASFSGTSYACALVSGFAALLRARFPEAGPDELEGYILETAVDIDALNPGFAGLLGAGRIDCAPAITTAVPGDHAEGSTPRAIVAFTAAPNPFNPRLQIRYSLTRPATVVLTVHDLRGRRVRTLVDEYRRAGDFLATWDGHDSCGRSVASASYRVELRVAGERQVLPVVLVR